MGNLVLLIVLAALAGAFALVLFSALGRVESRAHWGRAAGIARSRRLERRAFVIGVINGAPLECLCEEEKRGACFDPGP